MTEKTNTSTRNTAMRELLIEAGIIRPADTGATLTRVQLPVGARVLRMTAADLAAARVAAERHKGGCQGRV